MQTTKYSERIEIHISNTCKTNTARLCIAVTYFQICEGKKTSEHFGRKERLLGCIDRETIDVVGDVYQC
jgi:hypothetical protein